MQTLVDYFKSKLGILKICAVLFVALLVALTVYSHFNSHWAYHGSEGIPWLNDYEECLRYNPNPTSPGSSRSGTTIVIAEDGRTNHLITASENANTNSKPTCPDPALEIVLVSVAIPVLLLSILFLLLICRLSKPIPQRLWCQVKPFDMAFHCLSALFLLIGGILFICSAYFISIWCEVRLPPPPPYTAGGNVGSRSHHDDVAVIRTEDVEDSKDDGRSLSSNNGDVELSDVSNDRPVVRLLVPSVRHKRSIISDGRITEVSSTAEDVEFCNARNLTTEKYLAGAIALLVAILYAGIVYLIYHYAKLNAVDCSYPLQSQLQQNDREMSRKKCCGSINKGEAGTGTDQNANRRSKDMADGTTEGDKVKVDASV